MYNLIMQTSRPKKIRTQIQFSKQGRIHQINNKQLILNKAEIIVHTENTKCVGYNRSYLSII